MVLLGDEAYFGTFGDCANLSARYCMICTECTIGSKIILQADPMELVGGMGQVESCFGPFGDSVNVGAI
jgi:hypothetical protein